MAGGIKNGRQLCGYIYDQTEAFKSCVRWLLMESNVISFFLFNAEKKHTFVSRVSFELGFGFLEV